MIDVRKSVMRSRYDIILVPASVLLLANAPLAVRSKCIIQLDRKHVREIRHIHNGG